MLPARPLRTGGCACRTLPSPRMLLGDALDPPSSAARYGTGFALQGVPFRQGQQQLNLLRGLHFTLASCFSIPDKGEIAYGCSLSGVVRLSLNVWLPGDGCPVLW